MDVSNVKQVTATGDITAVTAYLRCVSLTGGSDAATLTVRSGGSAGTVILVVKAAASTTVPVPGLKNTFCGDGIHATLTGSSPSATFVYA